MHSQEFLGESRDICPNSVGVDVTDDGVVVEYSYLPNGVQRVFVYTSASGIADMATLMPDNSGTSQATAINSSNQVVGSTTAPTGGYPGAFVYDLASDSMRPLLGLGSIAQATAINDSNVVVGIAKKVGGVDSAVIWNDDAIRDLNELISTDSGWVLNSAVGINEHGPIVGMGLHNGSKAAFRLESYSADSDGDGVNDDID